MTYLSASAPIVRVGANIVPKPVRSSLVQLVAGLLLDLVSGLSGLELGCVEDLNGGFDGAGSEGYDGVGDGDGIDFANVDDIVGDGGEGGCGGVEFLGLGGDGGFGLRNGGGGDEGEAAEGEGEKKMGKELHGEAGER